MSHHFQGEEVMVLYSRGFTPGYGLSGFQPEGLGYQSPGQRPGNVMRLLNQAEGLRQKDENIGKYIRGETMGFFQAGGLKPLFNHREILDFFVAAKQEVEPQPQVHRPHGSRYHG